MKRLLIAASLAALALSGPAFADKDKGKGKDKPHPAQSHGYDDHRHDNGLHRGHHKQAWKRGERILLEEHRRSPFLAEIRRGQFLCMAVSE